MIELGLASNDVVEAFSLPERAGASEQYIALTGAHSLDSSQDFGERSPLGWLDQEVHVIRHDDPWAEFVAVSVEMAQALLNDGPHIRTAEMTRA